MEDVVRRDGREAWGKYLNRTNRKKGRIQGPYKIPKPALFGGPLPSQRDKVVVYFPFP